MYFSTSIDELLPDLRRYQIIDVRSPGEFARGHIPGAVNIPLFTDEERARVGTLYKQSGKEPAMEEGLKIAGVKFNEYLHLLKQARSDQPAIIHCWRGGKRSEAMQWLFNFNGWQVSRLHGGYKSYRQSLYDFFTNTPFQLKILGGPTGSGKTEVLYELQKRGEQIIDLEKIASHKGSAFGAIGENPQLTNEQFENNLYEAFLQLDTSVPIWLENESRHIGTNHIPEPLWKKMRSSTLYSIDVPVEIRIDRILKYYGTEQEVERLKYAFEKIKKRLGGLDHQLAFKALENNDLRTAALIALKYYDKAYTYQLEAWPAERVIAIDQCDDVSSIAENLIEKNNSRIETHS